MLISDIADICFFVSNMHRMISTWLSCAAILNAIAANALLALLKGPIVAEAT